ncbi:hypothetical protein GCM10017673_56590 [Streptosporangium violaceochromogenes]|nr:hypothetical protein GCM10017673_56590 [Streptosporangium violaceochromogenes]
MQGCRAAWVPEAEDRDWEDAAELAAQWVEAESSAQGARPVVVANGKHSADDIGVLSRMARQYGLATPRSRDSARGAGPVLAYVPTLETLELAIRAARNSSLCVVEGVAQPLAGWAAAVNAEDPTNSEPTTPLDSDFIEVLNSLVSYGNNGWGDQFGKQQTQRRLARLPRESLDPDFIASYMMGKGRSAHGAKNLKAIIEKLK